MPNVWRSCKSRRVVSLVLVLFLVATWLIVVAQSQESTRILEKIRLKNEPIEIMEVKVGNKNGIRLGDSFQANDDWLSGLTFKVKNVSSKQIVRIELELQFPEVKFNNGVFVLPVQYGQVPDLEEPAVDNPGPVASEAIVRMTVDPDTYGGIKRIINGNGNAFGVSKVRVRVSTIIFVDGTAWHNGYLHTRDTITPYSDSIASHSDYFRICYKGVFLVEAP